MIKIDLNEEVKKSIEKKHKEYIVCTSKQILEGFISDDEVEMLLEEKDKEYQWCDDDQDVFGEF